VIREVPIDTLSEAEQKATIRDLIERFPSFRERINDRIILQILDDEMVGFSIEKGEEQG
jgi:hypothetical protein